ncbi:hypothetical protein ACJX0J_007948, partial [Zea mays]
MTQAKALTKCSKKSTIINLQNKSWYNLVKAVAKLLAEQNISSAESFTALKAYALPRTKWLSYATYCLHVLNSAYGVCSGEITGSQFGIKLYYALVHNIISHDKIPVLDVFYPLILNENLQL